nr:uncharacterized protein LOC103351577 isoform X1 [Oryctolagus cuniculus]
MTPAPRCACALALLCLLSLLLLPERTAGDVLLLAVDTPRPRVARWLNLGPLNKYVEKIFSGRRVPQFEEIQNPKENRRHHEIPSNERHEVAAAEHRDPATTRLIPGPQVGAPGPCWHRVGGLRTGATWTGPGGSGGSLGPRDVLLQAWPCPLDARPLSGHQPLSL